MGFDPQYSEFLEEIKAKSDILSVVSATVQLKRKGNRYWGCCPFHNEKTPSFSVVPDQGFFYCFGCHKGGDVFKFVSLLENISYKDAIKLLADRNNIPIPNRYQSQREQVHEQERKNLWQIMEKAGDFFHNCLTKTNLGAPGREYFASRHIDEATINSFHLGFAPNLWDKFFKACQQKGIPRDLLLQAGLIAQRKNGDFYDRFRNRIIIPIANEHNKICGFGGRVIDGKDNPKYLNSPETPIFSKSNILFGLNQAKHHIKEQDKAIVVEGYMDAIALHTKGINWAVASLGTAFTIQQCRLLLRFTRNIYFCYDNDKAGQAATMRALAIAGNTGANVFVIMIPDGKDPDEFLNHHSPDEFLALLDQALPLMEFQLQYVLKNTSTDTLDGKLMAINQLLPLLANVNNAVKRNAYIIRIANVLGIDEGVIRSDMQKYQRNRNFYGRDNAEQQTQSSPPLHSDANTRAGRIVINNLWRNPQLFVPILEQLPLEFLPNPLHRSILQYMLEAINNKTPFSDTGAAEFLDPNAYRELALLLVDDTFSDAQTFKDCLLTLKIQILNSQYEHHRLLADDLQRKGDNRFLEELKLSQDILRQLDLLKETFK